jgi:uncharacterized protein (DUF952 family)
MATIFHIALAAEWEAARASGEYTTSTRGRTLAEVGFVHCSRADQWTKVRDAFYADVTEPLVLLQIDTDLLDVPVVEEPGGPGSTETFPHVYGRIPVAAVVKAIPLTRGSRQVPEPAERRPPTRVGPSPEASFTRLFLTEMMANAVLVMLIFVLGFVGLVAGSRFGDAVAPVVGAVVGLVVGGALARVAYVRRRHRIDPSQTMGPSD